MTQQTYGDYGDTAQAENDVHAQASPVEPVQVQPTAPTQQAQPSQPAQRKLSPLEEMVEDINATDLTEVKYWNVPDRPNWQLGFNCHISSDEFKEYQRQASGAKNRKARRSGSGAGDIDQFELASVMIQEKSTKILYKGQPVEDSDGDDMTLRSPEFVEFIQGTNLGGDVRTAAHAIEVFLTAGYMLQLGESIAAEAGYAGQAEPVNP